MSEPILPVPPRSVPPRNDLLTLDQALVEDGPSAIVVTERLRRWLELRPGLSLTLTSHRSSDGKVTAAVAIGWSYEHAPPKMAGTWAVLCEPERTDWPLLRALERAARSFEASERKGSSS